MVEIMEKILTLTLTSQTYIVELTLKHQTVNNKNYYVFILCYRDIFMERSVPKSCHEAVKPAYKETSDYRSIYLLLLFIFLLQCVNSV